MVVEIYGEEVFLVIRCKWVIMLYEVGWLGLLWFKEYGGCGFMLCEEIIFIEEEVEV